MLTAPNNPPEEIAEAAQCYGLAAADFDMPYESMFSAGLDKLSRMRKALAHLAHCRNMSDIALMRMHGRDPEAIDTRKAELQAKVDAGLREPLWKTISGLPDCETLPQYPRERRRALTILVNMVTKLCRWEIEHGESDEVALANSLPNGLQANEQTAPSLLQPLRKRVHWDPLQGICAALGLSRIALTRFAKEAEGIAAHEIVDAIRAAKVRAKLKEMLFPQLRDILLAEFGNDWKDVGQLAPRELWNKLRAARREPEFHRTQHAQQLGFPNYPRYFHACLNELYKAPSQIEMELIKEFLAECVRAAGVSPASCSSEAAAVLPSPLVGEEPGVRADGSTTTRRSSTSIRLPIAEPQQVQKNTTDQSETKVG